MATIEHRSILTEKGRSLHKYILSAQSGMELHLIDYGGIITNLYVPDKKRQLVDVVLGFDNMDQYFENHVYMGAIVGRYANRIADGIFHINNQEYRLDTNLNGHHIHGGVTGFNKVFWTVKELSTEKGVGVSLHYLSKDGDQGYPGNLNINVEYILTDDNKLIINYFATTDKSTPVSLTQHSYFNLSSDENHIYNHSLKIHSSKYLETDDRGIPSGQIISCGNEMYDFREHQLLSKWLKPLHHDLKLQGGYDLCYSLSENDLPLDLAAELLSSRSGIKMKISTTEKGLQMFTANFSKAIKGNNGKRYQAHCGICLEPQAFPNSPNQKGFPNVILEPMNRYQSTTVYAFETIA